MSPELREEVGLFLETVIDIIQDEEHEVSVDRKRAVETIETCSSVIASITGTLVQYFFIVRGSSDVSIPAEFLTDFVIPGMKTAKIELVDFNE